MNKVVKVDGGEEELGQNCTAGVDTDIQAQLFAASIAKAYMDSNGKCCFQGKKGNSLKKSINH